MHGSRHKISSNLPSERSLMLLDFDEHPYADVLLNDLAAIASDCGRKQKTLMDEVTPHVLQGMTGSEKPADFTKYI